MSRQMLPSKVTVLGPHIVLAKAVLTLAVCAALVVVLSSEAFGQATEGTILGTVLDSSGGAIPNAPIKVTNEGTGEIRETATDSAGEYVVPNLPVGNYAVEVESSGFKKTSQSGVRIEIKARVRVDFKLEIGQVTQSVKVTAAAPLLQPDTPEEGGTLTRSMLEDLPVFSRNFISLSQLVPGTTGGSPHDTRRDVNGATVTVGGATSEANNYIVDGVGANEEFVGTITLVPAMDAIQEFKVQSSQYSAEFGRGAGGVVNVAIKSGTNQLHGFAYDYLGNDALDAQRFFDVSKPPLRRNQFGGGVGGPIKKDKVFFFANYEGIRGSQPTQFEGIVPTVLEKSGDFSKSGYQVYDPTSTHPDPNNPANLIRNPFSNDVIPSGMLNPVAVALLQEFPNPNFSSPGISQNFLTILRNTTSVDSYTAKVDANLNERNTLSFRLSQQRGGNVAGGFLPNEIDDGFEKQDGTNVGLTYTHIFSPRLLNDFRIGYSNSRFGQVPVVHDPVLTKFNIPGLVIKPQDVAYPFVIMRNESATILTRPIGSLPNPFTLVEQTIEFKDDLSYQVGSHALKFGFGYSRLQDNRGQGFPGNALFITNGGYTSPQVGQQLPTGIPDLLVGDLSGYLTLSFLDAIRLRNRRTNAYVQDYWRATKNLTLSLGLRWDLYPPYTELRDRFTNFDFSNGLKEVPLDTKASIESQLGGPLPPINFEYTPLDKVLPQTNWHDFAPRVGFAYSATKRVVVRGGYGFFYGNAVANLQSNQGTNAPFFIFYGLPTSQNQPAILSNGFPGGGALGKISRPNIGTNWTPLNSKDPYSEKWSAGVEISPTSHTLIDVGYAGQHTLRFPEQVYGNVPSPGPGDIQPRRPYPNSGAIVDYLLMGKSKYKALQATVREDGTHGLSFRSALTVSSTWALSTGIDDNLLTDPNNFNYDYGPTDFDARVRWVTGLVYNTPRLANSSPVLRRVFGNWQASGVVTLQSGFPFQVLMNADTLNNGVSTRPNMSGDPNLPKGQRTLFHWFNTSAFSVPPLYVQGSEPRNPIRAPGLSTVDLGFQKAIPVGESRRFIVRMQSTNFFNRPNFGIPNNTVDGPDFGVINSLSTGARRIQLAMRFEF